MENKIEVYYKKQLVGIIAKYNDKYLFQYDDLWIKNGFSISPLSLPLRKELFVPSDQTFNGFFGVFADSLPDSWGKLLLDRYLFSKGIMNYDGLYRLACVGTNGMGALEYIPDFSYVSNEVFDYDKFQKQANEILNDSNIVNVDYLYKFAGSSGGARPKALVNINNEDWIIKFQSRFDIQNAGKCEYEYALACKKVGIEIPNVKLFKSNTNAGYFGIKRFDRINGEKVHMITAAALLEADFRSPCADYLDLFKLTKLITFSNLEDLKQLYLRMCFNVFAHNLDDHLKNFTYIYDEKERKYRLAPAYDMTYSNTFYGEHMTSVNRKGTNITLDDLILVGMSSGLDKAYCIDKAKMIKEVTKDLEKYIR